MSMTAVYLEEPPILDKKGEKNVKKFAKRKKKEYEQNLECKEFEFVEASSHYWYFRFVIEDGPYKGQIHIIEMKLIYGSSPNVFVYPLYAPLCRFVTSIWHPNISDKGTICLDMLKEQWSIVMTTSNIISAIKLLLLNPEPSSPQNPIAAKMMNNQMEYNKKIKSFYKYDVCEIYTKLFSS